MHAVGSAAEICFRVAAFVGSGTARPPSDKGVIIVGSGVDDSVGGELLRQIHVRAHVSEPELQHGHAGDLQSPAQCVHVGGNVAQIFGEER